MTTAAIAVEVAAILHLVEVCEVVCVVPLQEVGPGNVVRVRHDPVKEAVLLCR